MYRFVIFFLVSISLFVESVPFFENKNYNIIVNKKISNYGINYDLNETFVVLRDKPFNITFVDYASAGVFCRSKDKSYSLTWYVEMIMVGGKWNSVIKVQSAKEHMSTEWKCTFARKNEPDQDVTFKIRVKGKPKIKVTIGGVELNNSLSESTELAYDNIAYYWYEDGETIDLVCHQLNVGFLYIVYYDQTGRKLIETNRMLRYPPPNFQKIMHASDNNYIIDCKYDLVVYNVHHGAAYRTIFKLRPQASMSNKQEDSLDVRMKKINLLEEYKNKKSTEGVDEVLANFKNRNGPVKFQRVYGTKITVNDLKIIPKNVSAHLDKEEYQYKFFDGQILNVTCEKNKDLPGHLLFGTDNNEHLKSRILEETRNNLWEKTIILDTKNMTLEHLRCEVIGYTTANIMLALDPKELYVLGLPSNNVMYQYRNDSSIWIVDYQYSVGETLNLTCGARPESYLRWIFGNTTTRTVLKSKSIYKVITMQADHNEMKIICEEKSSASMKVIINLHRVENKKEAILFTIAPRVLSNRSDAVTAYAVFENQPFNITLLNYHASEALCYPYYKNLDNFPIKLENVEEGNKTISVIMVLTASEDMSRVWGCTLTKEDSSAQDIIFRIHVIGINSVNVTIGGLELKSVALNSSDEVNGVVSHYWYEAGEAIDLECVNRQADGTIQLRYYDTNCTKLIETDQLWQVPINFRKTMHGINDGDRIDCIYQSEYYLYTHRTIFKLKSEFSSKGAIGVHVNDFRLVPISVRKGNMSIYEYKYHEGETLVVDCEKDKSASGHVQYEANDIEVPECNKCCPAELQEQNLMSKKNVFKLNTKHLNEKHLTCNLTDNELISIADIRFLAETKQLYIIGLSMSDMIFQYKKNMSTWVLDYNCVEEQAVRLTCVVIAESNMRWIYTNSSEEFHNKTTSISYKFTLRPEVNVMTITCEATDVKTMYLQRIVVNLHRVRKSSKTSESGQDPGIIPDPEGSSNSKVIVIISFTLAMLVSLIGISIACRTCLKRKNTGDTQNTISSNRLQSRPLPEVPRQRQPLYCYDYVYSSSDYADLEVDETRNVNRNQQNTMYYWAYQ